MKEENRRAKKARAVEVAYGEIPTYGHVSVISYGTQLSVNSTAQYGYRQPFYARGVVQCEFRVQLGYP